MEAMTAVQNPIDKTQRERITGAERALAEAVNLLQLCAACDIDVADREAACAMMYDQLGKIKATFMPGEGNPHDGSPKRPRVQKPQ